MAQHKFFQVDVFTDKPFLGNPVAAVFDADELTAPQMQQIAHWANLSETIFFQKSETADYRLRIFTPNNELPFAGHPTIGGGWAAVQAGLVNSQTFTMQCGAGIVMLQQKPGGVIMAEVPPPELSIKEVNPSLLQDSFHNLKIADPVVINAGPKWIVGRCENQQALLALKTKRGPLVELSRQVGAVGATLYAIIDEHNIEVRSFAPAEGIDEDPVCGSGNGSVAFHLHSYVPSAVKADYTAHQGQCLGRAGQVLVERSDGKISIGGNSVVTIDGTIDV